MQQGLHNEGFELSTVDGKRTYDLLQSKFPAQSGDTASVVFAVKDGKGYMKDWRFVDGKDALPSDAEVKKMRPAN